MSDESETPEAPRPELDPATARRAKLVAVLLLNSRSREDFSSLVEHMGIGPGEEITRLYHECVASLADWKGLRCLGGITCDPDLDAGFVAAVEGLYAGLMEYLAKGTRSERKMARARKKAGKYAMQRSFAEHQATAERIVSSAVDMLETCSWRVPPNWIAEDPEKMPPPEPEKPEPAAAVEKTAAPEPIPEGPDMRTPLEKAADRLYGRGQVVSNAGPISVIQPVAESTPESAAGAQGSGPSEEQSEPDEKVSGADQEPSDEDKAAMERTLGQLTLVKFMEGLSRDNIVGDLVKNGVFGERKDAEEFVDEVVEKMCDLKKAEELLQPGYGPQGKECAEAAQVVLGRECKKLLHLLDEGKSTDELIDHACSYLKVPRRLAGAMADFASRMRGDPEEFRLRKIVASAMLCSDSREAFHQLVREMDLFKEEGIAFFHDRVINMLADAELLGRVCSSRHDAEIDLGVTLLISAFLRETRAVLEKGAGSDEAVDYVCRRCFTSDRGRAGAIVGVATRVELVAATSRAEGRIRDVLGTNELYERMALVPGHSSRKELEAGSEVARADWREPCAGVARLVAEDGVGATASDETRAEVFLNYSVLLKILAGWREAEVVDALIRHRIAADRDQGSDVYAKALSVLADRAELSSYASNPVSDAERQYAEATMYALMRQQLFVRAQLEGGRAGDGQVAAQIAAMIDVPLHVAVELLEIHKAYLKDRDERGAT